MQKLRWWRERLHQRLPYSAEKCQVWRPSWLGLDLRLTITFSDPPWMGHDSGTGLVQLQQQPLERLFPVAKGREQQQQLLRVRLLWGKVQEQSPLRSLLSPGLEGHVSLGWKSSWNNSASFSLIHCLFMFGIFRAYFWWSTCSQRGGTEATLACKIPDFKASQSSLESDCDCVAFANCGKPTTKSSNDIKESRTVQVKLKYPSHPVFVLC